MVLIAAVFTGLAVSTKINGAVTGLIFIVFCVYLLFVKAITKKHPSLIGIWKEKQAKIIFLSILIFIVMAFTIFIVINPYLVNNPFAKIKNIFTHRLETAQWQGFIYKEGLYTIKERALYIYKEFFSTKAEAALISKSLFNVSIGFILFLAGLFLMAKDEKAYILRYNHCSGLSVILIWFFVTFAALLATLLVGWPRYILPLLPSVALIIGYSIGSLASHFKKS